MGDGGSGSKSTCSVVFVSLVALAAAACSRLDDASALPQQTTVLAADTSSDQGDPSPAAEAPPVTTSLGSDTPTTALESDPESSAVPDGVSTTRGEPDTTQPNETAAPETQPATDKGTVYDLGATLHLEYDSFEPQSWDIAFPSVVIESDTRVLIDVSLVYTGTGVADLFDLTIGVVNEQREPLGDWWFSPCLDSETEAFNPVTSSDQRDGTVCLEGPGLGDTAGVFVAGLIDAPLTHLFTES